MNHPIDQQLAQLNQTDTRNAQQRVRLGLDQQAATDRRQVGWALAGVLVNGLAIGAFAMRGDSMVFVLLILEVCLLAIAWRLARRANELTVCEQSQWQQHWQRQLRQQLRQIVYGGPLIATAFSALSTWVVMHHGIGNPKTWMYLTTGGAIWCYVGYQWLVNRPRLQRELALTESAH